MNVLILYDSKFGNTKRVVETIQATIAEASHIVSVLFAPEVTADPAIESPVDLLIVAGPTHHESASEPIKKVVSLLQPAKWNGVPIIALSTDYRQAIDSNEKSAVHWIQENMANKGARLIDLLFRIPVEAIKGPMNEKAASKAAQEIVELLKQL